MKPDPEPPPPPPERTWMVTTAGETFFTASVTADVWSSRTLLTVVLLVAALKGEVESERRRLVMAIALMLPESIPTTSAMTRAGSQGEGLGSRLGRERP